MRRASTRLLAQVLSASIAVTGVVVCGGCESQHETNWGRLQQGMGQSEVEALLGSPSSRIDARREGNDVVVAHDRWQYGDNLSTLATSVVFPGEAPDRVWVVYFDDDGEVIEFRPPNRSW